MTNDELNLLMGYTPDELFHSMTGEDAMMSVMDMTPMDLVHHGIKGQKWGIRRFQPYRQGMKVLGGKVVGVAKKVKQRFNDSVDTHKAKRAAKTEAKAAKKQAKEEKKIEDFEAEKQKAIKTGTAEDLAKFKGKLTAQEYSEAFLRLQNEKKLNELVSANQKTVWDTIDSGMAIVEKVGKYASIAATAKENFTKLDDALHKSEKEDEKAAKDKAKNEFMNKATYDELIKDSSKYNLNTDEYQKVVSRLTKENTYKNLAGIKDPEPKEPDHTVRDNAAYDNSKPKDFEAPKKAYDKTPETVKDKAGYKNPDGEKGYEAPAQAVESGKRAINGFKSATKKTVYNTEVSLEFGESTVKRLSAKAPNAKQTLNDMEPTTAEKERATRMANVRNAYSVNREISAAEEKRKRAKG